jgi:hypothetical protein
MTPAQLYIVFVGMIAIYVIISSTNNALTIAAEKKTGTFVNGVQVWTGAIFGIASGLALLFITLTADGGASSSSMTRNYYNSG